MNFFVKSRGWFVGLLAFAVLASSFVFVPKSLALSWEQVSTSGFGDADNITSLNLVSFGDKLYASSGNYGVVPTGVQIFSSSDGSSWTQVNTSGFGSITNFEAVMTVYNSALYAATDTLGSGMSELWKTTNGTDWTQVGQSGFGDAGNVRVIGMKEYNGSLYIGATNVTGAEVWRLDSDGTMTQVNTDGFNATATVNTIFSLQEYNGALYAGAGTNVAGAQVWKTIDGTSWSRVMQGGFGDVNNGVVSTMFSFNDQLYAGTINATTGTEVWRTTTGDTVWEQVNTDGFGDALTSWSGVQTAIINGTVYLGTRNNTNGARLFTSTNGSTWTQEGTTGFGDPTNNYAIYAITFNGRIYLAVSSETGAEIWRTGEMGSLSIEEETSLDEGTVGDAYVETLSTNRGTSPMSWSVTSGSLPDGVRIDEETGVISGTPTRAESSTFSITVTDAGIPQQLASSEYTIKINEKIEAEVLPETGSSLGYWLLYRFL